MLISALAALLKPAEPLSPWGTAGQAEHFPSFACL